MDSLPSANPETSVPGATNTKVGPKKHGGHTRANRPSITTVARTQSVTSASTIGKDDTQTTTIAPTQSMIPAPASASIATNPSGILIGGAVGAVAFFVIVLGFALWYFRHQHSHQNYTHTESFIEGEGNRKASPINRMNQIVRAIMGGPHVHVFMHRHRPTRSVIIEPWTYSPDHCSQGGKQERLRRVCEELEEARRVRETFRQDLESLNNGQSGRFVTASPGGDVDRLSEQIKEMSETITALRLDIGRLMEEQPPPDYPSVS